MKLLLFSDLHTDTRAARSLVERAADEGIDVLVGAGDFGSVRRDVRACVDVLRALTLPAILVAGNNETTDELVAACRDWPTAHVLHGNGAEIAGRTFFGLGGGVPVTPFGAWSYDFTEDEAAALLDPCPAGCVLVSHSPPKGAVDLDSRGRSHGSTAVRAAILRNHPVLVVCGHIHASAGQAATIGPTPVVNAGPEGIVWEIPEPR
ncbi:MAG TPA: metallophosphoesterase family protein [Isosphaeraceae bacterium]|jgi:Icc-related predicted phosphoesterase|nr:metallophosphoesterase family protein [Isosphaeraceae bacterium]